MAFDFEAAEKAADEAERKPFDFAAAEAAPDAPPAYVPFDPTAPYQPEPEVLEPKPPQTFREKVMAKNPMLDAAKLAIATSPELTNMRSHASKMGDRAAAAVRGTNSGVFGEWGPKILGRMTSTFPALREDDANGEKPTYEAEVKRYQDKNAATEEQHPLIYGGAQLGGALAKDLIASRVAGPIAGPVGVGVIDGLGQGDSDSLLERGSNGLRMGTEAYAGGKLGEALGTGLKAAAPAVKKYFGEKARNNAIRSLNPGKTDIRSIIKDGDQELPELADYLLGDGPNKTSVLKPFMSVEGLGKRLDELQSVAGKKVDSSLAAIDDAVTPLQGWIPGNRGLTGGPTATRMPNYTGNSTAKRYLEELVPGWSGAHDRAAGGAAKNFLENSADNLKDFSGTLVQGQGEKVKLGRLAKFHALNAPDVAESAREAYGVFNDELENQALKMAGKADNPRLAIDYLTAKSEYAPAAKAGMIADKAAAAKIANRSIPPSSHVAGLAGQAAGPFGTGPALALVNTLALELGSSTLAMGAKMLRDKLPPKLVNSPAFMKKWGPILAKSGDPLVRDTILGKTNEEYAADREAALNSVDEDPAK